MGKTPTIIRLPSPSPSEAAELEISMLRSRPEFQTDIVFGGPMPAAMKKRNAAKIAAFNKAKLKVIAKYGLFDEYLQPLLEEEKRLKSDLESVQAQIKELQRLRKR